MRDLFWLLNEYFTSSSAVSNESRMFQSTGYMKNKVAGRSVRGRNVTSCNNSRPHKSQGPTSSFLMKCHQRKRGTQGTPREHCTSVSPGRPELVTTEAERPRSRLIELFRLSTKKTRIKKHWQLHPLKVVLPNLLQKQRVGWRKGRNSDFSRWISNTQSAPRRAASGSCAGPSTRTSRKRDPFD